MIDINSRTATAYLIRDTNVDDNEAYVELYYSGSASFQLGIQGSCQGFDSDEVSMEQNTRRYKNTQLLSALLPLDHFCKL